MAGFYTAYSICQQGKSLPAARVDLSGSPTWSGATASADMNSRGGHLTVRGLNISPAGGDRVRVYSVLPLTKDATVVVSPSYGFKNGEINDQAFGSLSMAARIEIAVEPSIVFTVQPLGAWGSSVDGLVWNFHILE